MIKNHQCHSIRSHPDTRLRNSAFRAQIFLGESFRLPCEPSHRWFYRPSQWASLGIYTRILVIFSLRRLPFRQELLHWLNSLLQLNITKVEQCGTGYAYFDLLSNIPPLLLPALLLCIGCGRFDRAFAQKTLSKSLEIRAQLTLFNRAALCQVYDSVFSASYSFQVQAASASVKT